MNYGSTDSNGGFQCLSFHESKSVSEIYLSRTDVRQSLHIPDFVQPWTVCKDDIVYHGSYSTMSHSIIPVYLDIIQSTYAQTKGLKILLYNGDNDTPDDLMIAELFIEDLLKISNNATTTLNRTKWLYTINNWTSFVTAGFVKSLNFYGMASLDLLTIKGAGHFAATDRPGPSLQVLYNFLKSSNYSTPVPELQSSPGTTSTTPSTLASASNLVVLVLIPYLTHILRWF